MAAGSRPQTPRQQVEPGTAYLLQPHMQEPRLFRVIMLFLQLFSGRGLGRRLFQKGGLPSVPPYPRRTIDRVATVSAGALGVICRAVSLTRLTAD